MRPQTPTVPLQSERPDTPGAAATAAASAWRRLEGSRVAIALSDGTRLEDCELVSVGRGGARTLWIATNGIDMFIASDDVSGVWLSSGAVESSAA
jgi:hypothetical protein